MTKSQQQALLIAQAVTEQFELLSLAERMIKPYTAPSMDTVRVLTTTAVFKSALRVIEEMSPPVRVSDIQALVDYVTDRVLDGQADDMDAIATRVRTALNDVIAGS